jgi:hypothetical protein
MRVTLKTAIAALALASLAVAGTEQHRKFTEDSLKGWVSHDKVNNRAETRRGNQKQAFTVQNSRNGNQLKVSMVQTGGANIGRAAFLEYDEPKQTVKIGAAGKELAVVINPDNTVMAGSTRCQGRDSACIANAVISSIPNLIADEVAAMLLALNDDLHSTQHGDHISSALLQIAGELNRKANPRPTAEGK